MHPHPHIKNLLRKNPLTTAMAAAFVWAIFTVASTQAAVLTYDTDINGNPGWFTTGTNAWSGDPSGNWISGSSAVVRATAVGTTLVELTQDTNIENLTLDSHGSGNNTIALTSTTGSQVLQMSGGNISVTSIVYGAFVQNGVSIQGDFTFTGGWLRANSNTSRQLAYVGTATVQAGRISYTYADKTIGTSSNFIVTGGQVELERAGAAMGTLTLNGGSFVLGRLNSTTSYPINISTVRLEGNNATAIIQTQGDAGDVQTFVVNQTDDTTYAGKILGTPAASGHTNRLKFEKDGTGDLTLTGEIDLRRTTAVNDGRLYINSTNTNFQDEAGSTAISVAGGVLGGTGTVSLGLNDNVVVGANGALAAGIEGVAGQTTYALNGGSLDLSAATASANTGWLRFDLGAATTAGTTYDQILLTGGSLNIGTGLNFNDFDFTALSGLGVGTYTLFNTPNAILGTLGLTTGTIGSFDGTLSIFNNQELRLSVVPEPGSLALLLAGSAMLVFARRRPIR